VIRLKAPETARDGDTVGFDGAEFAVEDGHVEVPEAAEAALRPHGYRKADAARKAPGQKKR
jgi:hypothetical protein